MAELKKTEKFKPMKRSQWHLLFWSCVLLAILLHVNFCDWKWNRETPAEEIKLVPVWELQSGGETLGGLYAGRVGLSFTTAFLCGIVLPLIFLAGAGFLLLDRPRPSFPPLRKYLEELKTGDDQTRAAAAASIAALGKRAAEGVPELGRALKDDRIEVRVHAAKALALIGPEAQSVVPDLIEGLGDKAGTVRECCARALGKIGEHAEIAVPALKGLLKDENELVRLYAMEALERIRGNRWKSDSTVVDG